MVEASIIASNADIRKSERSRRVLSNTSGITLFTNSELHILLDSVPSTMDSHTLGQFTRLCEAFIQDSLKMPSVQVIHFNVIVTRQALLESELRNLLQGLRRTTEQAGKLLALDSVVTTKYTSSEGDLIDPSDFHRYLRLLVNTRGGDFANELESTGVQYFRNITKVLTYSSAVKPQPDEDQPLGSSEQGLTDEASTQSSGMSPWAIVIVVIGATAAAVLVIVMIIRRIHAKRPTTTQFVRKKQQSPFSVVELSEYLELDRSNIVDAPTYPSTNLDYERCSIRGHSDLSNSPRGEIDHSKILEVANTWHDIEAMEETSRNEPKHPHSIHSPIPPSTSDANSSQAIPQRPMEALGHATLTRDGVSTCSKTDSNLDCVPMGVVQFSQYSDVGSNANAEGIQEKHSVVAASSDKHEAKRKKSIRKANRQGRKARKQSKGTATTVSSISRDFATERKPTVEHFGRPPFASATQPLTLTNNPIITVQSRSYGFDHHSMSSISESDSEVD